MSMLPPRQVYSRFLVFLQFFGLGLALLPWAGSSPKWGVVPLLAAGVLGAWALWHNRPGNFRILPELTDGASLVMTGPYAWVRHPMYSALMLLGLAGVLSSGHGLNLVGWGIMVWALWAKSRREELLLQSTFGGYQDYMRRTRRFVPGLW